MVIVGCSSDICRWAFFSQKRRGILLLGLLFTEEALTRKMGRYAIRGLLHSPGHAFEKKITSFSCFCTQPVSLFFRPFLREVISQKKTSDYEVQNMHIAQS
jgi:hypothetical protein